MKKSLLWKLILAFILVAMTTAVLVAVFIRVTSANRLMQLLMDQQRTSLQTVLAEYYSFNRSWVGVEEQWDLWRQETYPSPNIPVQGPPRNNLVINNKDRRSLFGLADEQGMVIIAVEPDFHQGTMLSGEQLKDATPVEVDGKQVGAILTAQWTLRFNPEEDLFLQRTNRALLFAALAAVLVGLLVAIILAQTLIKPLRALTGAAQNITAGKYDQEVRVKSKDEIGQLAKAFNSMIQEVNRVNQLRRKMTADIAHDLRTPLTVIAGYIESIRDGVLQPTEERLAMIYAEIERLQNLVGDLKMLSQVDAGELPLHLQNIAPRTLLERVAAVFNHRAGQQGVAIRVEAGGQLQELQMDESRMMQVFDNLVSNALRYTSDGGNITLSARADNQKVTLTVRDDGLGIAGDELPHIFERFHRADTSRHADNGESGLGLAIVKSLVEAHGGTVSAESKVGQGTAIHVTLNLA